MAHYYIYHGSSTQNYNKYEIIKSDQEISDPKTNEDLCKRISSLRKWRDEFFEKISLTKMSWYGLEIIDLNNLKRSDFDMILRLNNKEKSEQVEERFRLELVDSKDN